MSNSNAMKIAYLHAALNAKTACCNWQKEHDKLQTLQAKREQLIENYAKCKDTAQTYQNASLLSQKQNYLKSLAQQINADNKQVIDASNSEKQLHNQWLQRLTKAKALAKVLSNMED